MPAVVRTDEFRFVIYANDHAPPHVHVKLRDGQDCRIDLLTGDFMDTPPRGTQRRITKAYYNNIDVIWAEWEKYHADEP